MTSSHAAGLPCWPEPYANFEQHWISRRLWMLALTLLVVLGTANGLWWMQHKQERWYPGQDSSEYHLLGQNLSQGQGFSRENVAPYEPTYYREPGYPLFLAGMFALGGSDDAVATGQSVLIGISALITAMLARRVTANPLLALMDGTMVALLPDLGDHARYEMSEALFTPALLLALLAVHTAWRTPSLRTGVRAGVLFGAATLVRIVAMPTAGLSALGVALTGRGNRRARWTAAGVTAACLALVVSPWVLRNDVRVGNFALTGRGGGFIIPRADKAAAPADHQRALYSTAAWVVTYPLSQLVVPTSHMYREPNLWDGPLGQLELLDTTHAFGAYCQDAPDLLAQDRCFTATGLALIATHLPQYVLMTPLEFVRLTFYIYPSKLAVLHNGIVWLGLLGIAAMLVRSPRPRDLLWLVWAMIAYTLPSIAGDTQPRYGVPIMPLYAIFASWSLLEITGLLRVGLEARRALPVQRPSGA